LADIAEITLGGVDADGHGLPPVFWSYLVCRIAMFFAQAVSTPFIHKRFAIDTFLTS
jgi:hypothetical protein